MESSDYTGTQTKLPKILLNGNNICMVKVRLGLRIHLLMPFSLFQEVKGQWQQENNIAAFCLGLTRIQSQPVKQRCWCIAKYDQNKSGLA